MVLPFLRLLLPPRVAFPGRRTFTALFSVLVVQEAGLGFFKLLFFAREHSFLPVMIMISATVVHRSVQLNCDGRTRFSWVGLVRSRRNPGVAGFIIIKLLFCYLRSLYFPSRSLPLSLILYFINHRLSASFPVSF